MTETEQVPNKPGRAMCTGGRASMKRQYNPIVHGERDRWWAEVPELPGCYAEGKTRKELARNLRAAIREHELIAEQLAASGIRFTATVCTGTAPLAEGLLNRILP